MFYCNCSILSIWNQFLSFCDNHYILINLLCVGACAFFFFRLRKSFQKHKTKFLLICTVIIFVLGFVVNVIPNWDCKTWWASFVESAVASIEMFFSETKLTEIMLEKKDWLDKNETWYLPIYFSVYCCALTVSIYFVIDLLLRVFSNKWWLFLHRKRISEGEMNVFFCLQPQCIFLAKDLVKEEKADHENIVFINPTPNTEERLSLPNLLKDKYQTCEKEQELEPGKKSRVLVSSDSFLSENDSADLFSAMGLSSLKPVVHNPNARLYLISDNEEDNIRILNGIISCQDVNCEIFCHARHEALMKRFMDSFIGINLHFIDTSVLAVHEIKKSVSYQPIHPVNYVNKDVEVVEDTDGRKKSWLSGCVSSPFNALVLGFGGCGQEMLGFLYEYGSFVNSERKRSPWHATVYDEKIDERGGAFLSRCPGFHSELVEFRNGSVGTASFWKELKGSLGSVNYVVVALGNDDLNLSVGLDVLQFAYNERNGNLDNFVILVHHRGRDGYIKGGFRKETLDYYNGIYCDNGQKMYFFGGYETIWTSKVIFDEDVDDVNEYFSAYLGKPKEEKPFLVRRNKMIESLRKIREAKAADNAVDIERDVLKPMFNELQDYANYFHAYTKRQLCPEEFFDKAEFIKRIKDSNENGSADETIAYSAENGKEGSHVCNGCGPEAEKVFENLAITEHLRWISSLELLGFQFGNNRNYYKKRHDCMIPYDDLNTVDEARNSGKEEKEKQDIGTIKHYDWQPVMMSLMKYGKRLQK